MRTTAYKIYRILRIIGLIAMVFKFFPLAILGFIGLGLIKLGIIEGSKPEIIAQLIIDCITLLGIIFFPLIGTFLKLIIAIMFIICAIIFYRNKRSAQVTNQS